MPNISTNGVVGDDGIAPVYNPEGRWQLWSINDIWMGLGPGSGRFVPKIGDYVIDPDTTATYIVETIDPVTLVPTLREKRLFNTSYTLSETDVLFGVGPGSQTDTYRVYLDTSVTPHVLAVDARLKIPGSQSNYMKIFKGSLLGNGGRVVSKTFDNSGNFVSENVPLELVAIDSHVNYSIKTPKVCHCTEALSDGEIVTLVAYSVNGHVTYKRQMMVENTSFIRDVNASTRYVSHISLKTPFLSSTDTHTINFPLNVPLNALNLIGVVHYSDGSTMELPVDGTKFTMLGLNQYVSTIIGQKVKLVLSYHLGQNETAYGSVMADGQFVTQAYDLITSEANNSYTVKLYGYPVWASNAVGYRMQWFLFNLDRNVFFDVTANVRFADNTGAFDPFADGYAQRRSVYLNLRDVSGTFKPFVHTQMVEVMLRTPPDGQVTPWTVSQEAGSDQLPYGTNLTARRSATAMNVVNISAGITQFSDWINAVYRKTYPLIDRVNQASVPEPTHFELSCGTHKQIYSIADWSTNIALSQNVQLKDTVFIKFIRRTATTDLELSMAAMMIRA